MQNTAKKCEKCDYSTTLLANLKQHSHTHRDKKYKFKECDYLTRWPGNLKRHILETSLKQHSVERPFICEKCQKSFKRNVHLMRHEISHTGKSPYSSGKCKNFLCEKCQKSFKNFHRLKTHSAMYVHQSS